MKPYFLSLLLLAPGLAAAQTAQPFILKGQVNPKINAPAKVYLHYGDKNIDSTSVKNGLFTLKGKIAVPGKAFILLSQRGSAHDLDGMGIMHADFKSGFYLEPGTTTFTSSDSLKHAKVMGGQLTTQWQNLENSKNFVAKQFKQYYAEYDAATPEQRKSPEFRQARVQQRAGLCKQAKYADSLFVSAHPTSLVSLDQIGMLSNDKADTTTARHLLSLLTPALRASLEGQHIVEKLAAYRRPRLSVGMPAPSFTLLSATGQLVTLSSYRGKYVLVDFWASWCAPCRAENPNVARVYQDYKTRNFDVLGVSIDAPDNRAKWLKAVQDDNLPWTQVLNQTNGPNQTATLYQVEAIPQNFLIDPSGKIVALNLRGERLKSTLAQFIK